MLLLKLGRHRWCRRRSKVFGWFKRRDGAPPFGPDYRRVTTRAAADKLCRQGELAHLLLLPVEFGGQDIRENVVHVPPFVAELKARIDREQILPLAHEGKVSRYTATPEYEGSSVVPTALRIEATDPGSFGTTIHIWGAAVQRAAAPARQGPLPSAPALAALDAAARDDPAAFVRAFIGDYHAWNDYAHRIAEADPAGGMDAADAAYAALVAKFCRPGLAPQGVAFGSDSSHDNARESVLGVEANGAAAIVRTRHASSIGTTALAHDYEYHLQSADGRWFLASLLYVANDGKYECL